MRDGDQTGGAVDLPRTASSLERIDDRLIFNVELRPGETTIVSWKKLLRDAGRAGGSTSSAPEPPANAHPSLESRFTSGQPAENEAKEAPAGPHRFSAVIEKIERLYMGKHSSDEEDLNDYPDDDQYDTEDSFIDDAELDEYFEVDKSEIKHDGFFVNRGKLESINETTVSPNQQLKKRRRKDILETHGEVGDDHITNKDAKLNKVAAGKTSLQKSDALSPSQSLTAKKEQFGGFKVQNKLNAPAVALKKKYAEAGISLGDSSSIKVSNGPSAPSLEIKKIEKQKKGAIQSKSFSNKLKHGSGPFEGMNQKYLDKSVHSLPKSHSAKPLHNVNGVEVPVHIKEKYSNQEFLDNKVSKHPTPTTKTSHMHKKDGSSIKPKGTMLERAIRELERMVTESRPSSMENQEADVSSQAIKRRLPREIKLKLAKVARLAASHGKISEELINRLMSILGHLMQRRTLKRNLKVMISMGVSAKQEKDNRFQLIKNEVVEMIKLRPPTLESKALEQQAGRSDDFQETGPEGKGVSKRKFSMDIALEDKICDLYDLYVDGLDDDAGQQIRKLYAELADLWPSGFMDNHGIKRAICRAKERRKALFSSQKDQEKVKKKMLVPKPEGGFQVEGSSGVQPQHARDPGCHGLPVATKPVSSTSVPMMPVPSTDGGPNMDKPKSKESSGNSAAEARVSEITTTKKVAKRKAEHEVMVQEEERHKSYKQAAELAHKSSQQATAPS